MWFVALSVVRVLVGNKCDLESERAVRTEEGKELASSWSCPFFETSAKNKINHEACFFEVVREIRRQKPQTTTKIKPKCTIL
jgi:GTPase SAR1 family protein